MDGLMDGLIGAGISDGFVEFGLIIGVGISNG